MNILFLDTETNGLIKNYKATPKEFWDFPEILSIAWIMWDTHSVETQEFEHIIKRDIRDWDKYAIEVNGFSQEKINKEGVDFGEMIEDLSIGYTVADLIVCHNVSFDVPVLNADIVRNNLEALPNIKSYCTQQETTSLLKIERPYGYKWPKLEELHEYLFKSSMHDHFNAHNALDDVRCTMKCFMELVDIEHIRLDSFDFIDK